MSGMKQVVDQLRRVLPPEVPVTDPDRIQGHRYYRAMLCPAGEPLAVVLPRARWHTCRHNRRSTWPAALRRAIKAAMDLDNILNPGKVGALGEL